MISSQSRSVFCALSRLFVRPGFRLFCSRLTVHYLAVYSVFRSLIEQTLKAPATSTKKVCVIILYSFLCRCLQKVTKQHREIPTFCIFERTWTIGRPICKITYPFWDIFDSIDKLNESKLVVFLIDHPFRPSVCSVFSVSCVWCLFALHSIF